MYYLQVHLPDGEKLEISSDVDHSERYYDILSAKLRQIFPWGTRFLVADSEEK